MSCLRDLKSLINVLEEIGLGLGYPVPHCTIPYQDAMKSSYDEKIDLERDGSGEVDRRSTTAGSESSKSDQRHSESIREVEPVTIDEPLGTIETKRSVRRSQSRASSTASRPYTVVPRSQRRGLLGSLTLVPEISYPPAYKKSTKWALTFIIALATAAAPLGSTVVYRTSFLQYPLMCDAEPMKLPFPSWQRSFMPLRRSPTCPWRST